eukprot:TRINITY_DN227_c0_g1_i10.p1 TRINITY_DN227_c0_g1~~TRINITY_DN227_c0_g1_i10.p1  ORF type:complete len:104 (+),score=16.06 TRINITY_DN227_c0_g1_i10:503-814(+)
MGVGFFSRLPLVGGFFQREYRILVVDQEDEVLPNKRKKMNETAEPQNNNQNGERCCFYSLKKVTVDNAASLGSLPQCILRVVISSQFPEPLDCISPTTTHHSH